MVTVKTQQSLGNHKIPCLLLLLLYIISISIYIKERIDMISNQKLMKLIIVLLVACQSSAIISYYVKPNHIVLQFPKDLTVEGINVGDWEMRRGLAGKSDEVYFYDKSYPLPVPEKNVTHTNELPNSSLEAYPYEYKNVFPLVPSLVLHVSLRSQTTGKTYIDAVWVLSQDEGGKLLVNGKPAVDTNNNPLATANRYKLSFEVERYKDASASTSPYIKMIPSIIS